MLHAANQDLPCLAEIGLVPRRIFDTELAARLAGLPASGSARWSSRCSGFSLQKGHSAADWSTRPLPEEWLVYAALDVEVLVDLRDALAAILEEQGKTRVGPPGVRGDPRRRPAGPKTDPWRRTSGVHGLRSRRQLGILRSLWQARDDLARRRDIAPGRVLPDSAMVSAVQADPAQRGRAARAAGLPRPGQPQARRHLVQRDRPRPRRPGDRAAAAQQAGRGPAAGEPVGRPRPRRRHPAAGGPRGLAEISEKHSVPVENLLSPDLVRRIMWSPPEPRDADDRRPRRCAPAAPASGRSS